MRAGEFEIKDRDLAGRIGRLHTPHGTIETPAVLPVIDLERQEVPVSDIREVGFEAVITNAYLLWRRMREEALAKKVHGVLGFDGVVMTDSGAYQILRYGSVEVEPLEIVEFEKGIESDIAVILDVPSGGTTDRRQAEESVRETLRRAWEALSAIDPDKRVWVLPVQGGPFEDLVVESAKESAKLSDYYQVFALGSPTVLLEKYEYRGLFRLVYAVRKVIPLTKPLHLFGAGHPMMIPFAVALGVDLFDSASYILYARDNRYMTLTHTYRLEDLDYFPCSCPVCSRREPRELLELPAPERTRLLALHNLYVLRQCIQEVKVAIKEGRLWELLEERCRAHPHLFRAFKEFKRFADLLDKVSPRVKGGEVHGLFLYDELSLARPEVRRHVEYVTKRFKPRGRVLVLFPGSLDVKPQTSTKLYARLRSVHRAYEHLVAYVPFLGPIPEELAETYPLSQFEADDRPSQEVLEDLLDKLVRYVEAHKGVYEKVLLYVCKDVEWSLKLLPGIERELRRRGTRIEVVELERCDYM